MFCCILGIVFLFIILLLLWCSLKVSAECDEDVKDK